MDIELLLFVCFTIMQGIYSYKKHICRVYSVAAVL